MASGEMKLSMVLTGKDQGAKRLLQETERHLQRSGAALREKGRQSAVSERLGVRSERAIQREILQTQAAYNRLARSGKASLNDLARAAAAPKNRIRELNTELQQGIEKQNRWGSGLKMAGAGGAAVLAGATAAYATLKPAMDNQKQLDANITQVAWQAYGEDDNKSADWIASQGKAEIRALALSLVESNGGTHDAALQLINSMMANGMSYDEAKANAQSSHKAMIASSEGLGDYNAADTAKLFKVLSDFGFKGDDLGKAFEYAMKSGMQGNFEIADMVRELPALLPAAKAAGMDGLQGFGFLLSTLQSASNKAGSNSEAANNVRNLLEKTLSADTVKRLSKTANPNAPGQGIDWRASVLQGKANGESAVEVLARLADTMLAKDGEYQSYKKRADAGDKTAESQMNIMKGFVMSSLLPDIQAQGGLIAASDLEQVQTYMQGLMGLDPNASLVDKKLAVLQQSAGSQQEKAESEALLKQDVSAVIEAETALKQLTAEYPNATLAVQALAAAAVAASGALGLIAMMGGGGAGGAAKAAGMATRFGLFGIGAAAGGYGLYDANQRINRNEGRGLFEGGLDSRAAGYGESAASGALAGAMVGSVVPIIGTAAGAVAGGVIGLVSAAVADLWKEKPPEAQALPSPLLASVQPPEPVVPVLLQQTADYTAAMQANSDMVGGKLEQLQSVILGANQTINNNMTVTLDGRVIANEVSRHQYLIFNRGAGQ